MIVVPSRRWLIGAAMLAIVALAGMVWPAALYVMLALNVVWLLALAVDYRAALPVSDAIAELERCSGSQFDPSVVRALLWVLDDRGVMTAAQPSGRWSAAPRGAEAVA